MTELRVTIDRTLCIGSGTCEALAPELFRVGDDGIAELVSAEIDPATAEEAARSCPSGAISVES